MVKMMIPAKRARHVNQPKPELQLPNDEHRQEDQHQKLKPHSKMMTHGFNRV